MQGVEYAFVRLVEVGRLLPHEEFVPSRAREVARSILRLGAVLRPILVEANTYVVLDGAHRLAALRMLGARYAPAILVDYASVGLGGWLRVYGAGALRDARDLLPVARAYRLGGALALELEGEDSYAAVRALERLGHRLLAALPPGSVPPPNALVVIPPRPTRELVLRAAMGGEPLPPKSTRHLTPLKNVYSPVPLSELL